MSGMSFRSGVRGVVMAMMVALATACGGTPEPAVPATEPVFKPFDPSAAPPATLAVTSVERYGGTLPCADCAGIHTELTLVHDPATGAPRSYQLSETYLGSMSREDKPVVTSGTFTVTQGVPGDAVAPVIRLDGGGLMDREKAFERLSALEVRLLDQAGARIASNLNYTLTRMAETPFIPPPDPSAAPAPAPVPGGEPVAMVTDLASGWPVALKVGQPMVARLSADQAAGGRWTLRAGSDAGIVVREGEPVFEAVGAGSVQVIRLKAVKPGTASVTFDYTLGQATTPGRSVSYPITVQ
jgi:copper homeostasis protein (lipoprotein)